ncbi:hypothetical protein [Candidatus Ichthyocystis sparus]|uniref:hypothetical protein n=1 Tax=Candidatus Ichthyocystis sparus TaxID=1561004 RepID=UPI0011466B16|nr:hypothetical protein [Candidatus Ichthyocystis sparus]
MSPLELPTSSGAVAGFFSSAFVGVSSISLLATSTSTDYYDVGAILAALLNRGAMIFTFAC